MITKFKILFKAGWRTGKPLLLVRVAWGYAWAFLGKTPPLHYVDVATDYRCNLRCQHCFAVDLSSAPKNKLTLSEYRRFCNEAMRLGCIHFSFQGGEVLLDRRLSQIIKAFSPSLNYLSLTTNGTLLTATKIKELKRLGINQINFSFDSSFAQEHDRFRGVKGSFQKAWRAMQLAIKEGLVVHINTTLTHQNLHSPGIKKLFDWAIKNKVVINPIFACPVGRWQKNSGILLTPEDRQTVDRWQAHSAFIQRDLNGNWFRFGCPAVKEAIYLTPDGEVLPCPFIHRSLGNIKKQSLQEIREKGLRQEIFQKYHQKCLVAEASKDENFAD